MANDRECRVCKHHYFDTDVEVLTFHCAMGYFSYQEGMDGLTGRLPAKGISPDMPCEGKAFDLDRHSRWYKNIDENASR